MKWSNTSFPGVRFREHPIRKHGVKKDRYFAIRCQMEGKRREEGLGWASEGWTAQKAAIVLAELKKAHTVGEGPQSLKEKREAEQTRRTKEIAEKAREEAEGITFGAIFEGPYLEHSRQNKKPNSVVTELGLYKQWLAPVIGETPLKDVSPFQLERVKKNMNEAGRAARTVYYALCVVRQVFNFARDHNLTECFSPTSKVKPPRADNRRLRFLSHAEATRILEHLGERAPKIRDMALISLHCGLRAGEIFSLTWADVDFERGVLTLRDTKSGRNRAAYMTQEVMAMLAEKQRGAPSDLVFEGRGGVKRSWVSNSFERAVKELGLNEGVTDPRQKVVFHTLRHTFASWLVEQGTDLYSVKELMGHSTLSMTERYSHLAPDTLRRAVRKLEKGIAEKSEAGKVVNMQSPNKPRRK